MAPWLLALALSVSASPPAATLEVIDLEIQGHKVLAEVADTPTARAQGLMFRSFLGAEQGMVFVYPRAEIRAFWMANTTVPLSIAFIDATGMIVSIRDMRPLDREHTWSGLPAQYALEVNQGWFEQRGIEPGAKVEGLPGPSRE
jgi:uncharacterized membrane protein (UPF0127 family)